MFNYDLVALQMVSFMMLNLTVLIYIGMAKALQGRDLNRLDLINETFITVMAIHLVILTDFI